MKNANVRRHLYNIRKKKSKSCFEIKSAPLLFFMFFLWLKLVLC